MKYSLYQESRKGGRASNQDRVGHTYTAQTICMVLADGMGGHARGEVAAQLLVDEVLGAFERSAKPHLEEIPEFLLDCLYGAHAVINDYAHKNRLKDTPRTTAIVCVVQDERAWWAHVGDSRLYHFGAHGMLSRTRDHSAVQNLIDEGLLTEDEASTHPERNKLYNSVGGPVLPDIELSQAVNLHDGDIILLGSDGFWAEFKPDEMSATLRVYSLRQAVAQMLEHAEFRAGPRGDNLSIVALRCGEDVPDIKTNTLAGFAMEGFTTELQHAFDARVATDEPTMSDQEIDRAIEEIQAALNKHQLDKK